MNEKIGSNQRGYSHGFLHLSLKGDNCNVDKNSISCCRKIRSRKSLIPKDAIEGKNVIREKTSLLSFINM